MDKVEPEKQGEQVYQMPCKCYDASYIWQTGLLFKVRIYEYKKNVENVQKEQYTRSEMKQSQSTTNKSALTDQTVDWGVGVE